METYGAIAAGLRRTKTKLLLLPPRSSSSSSSTLILPRCQCECRLLCFPRCSLAGRGCMSVISHRTSDSGVGGLSQLPFLRSLKVTPSRLHTREWRLKDNVMKMLAQEMGRIKTCLLDLYRLWSGSLPAVVLGQTKKKAAIMKFQGWILPLGKIILGLFESFFNARLAMIGYSWPRSGIGCPSEIQILIALFFSSPSGGAHLHLILSKVKSFFTQTAACLSVFQNVFLDLAISSEPAEERCTNRGCVKTTHPLEYLCVQYQNWPLTTEQSIIYHMFFYRVAGANPNCHWTRERYSSPVHRRATQKEQPFTPHRQRLSNSIVWLNEYV